MNQIIIDPEFNALIPPLLSEEMKALEVSLESDGCLDSLKVWRNGKGDILLDGHNRREICTRLGISYKTESVPGVVSRDSAKTWIIHNQFARRNLAPYQRAELALKLERHFAEQAKAEQIRKPGVVVQKSAQQKEEGKTRSAIAKVAGVSHDTIAKAKLIGEKASEEAKKKLRTGQTTINREYKAIVQRERKVEQVAAIKTMKLPEGRFHVIVVDPPWSYNLRPADPSHRAANPYPSMSVEQICDIPVQLRAHDNCVLWLWTTNAFMVQAHQVAKAWGFEVKTILTWAKDKIGTGDWLRGQTEHCLMCVKGRPVVNLTNQSTLLHGPMREHSRKPDEFHALVESLCPGLKCELFSRQEREGWAAFGAEATKF